MVETALPAGAGHRDADACAGMVRPCARLLAVLAACALVYQCVATSETARDRRIAARDALLALPLEQLFGAVQSLGLTLEAEYGMGGIGLGARGLRRNLLEEPAALIPDVKSHAPDYMGSVGGMPSADSEAPAELEVRGIIAARSWGHRHSRSRALQGFGPPLGYAEQTPECNVRSVQRCVPAWRSLRLDSQNHARALPALRLRRGRM